ncbi:MAG: hypothetical protein ACTS42_01610 [Candidatus Hodgkinia cicadicola]
MLLEGRVLTCWTEGFRSIERWKRGRDRNFTKGDTSEAKLNAENV